MNSKEHMKAIKELQSLASVMFGEYTIHHSNTKFNLYGSYYKLTDYPGANLLRSVLKIEQKNDFSIKHCSYDSIEYLALVICIYGSWHKAIATRKGEMNKLLLRFWRNMEQPKEPILRQDDYNNTIGSIKQFIKSRKQFKKYGVSINKGILIWGKPGNGKTLITSYLKSYGEKRGLSINIIKEELIRNNGEDILIFDDFSINNLIKRTGITDQLLTIMDGPDKKGGQIYLFTTNELEDSDELYEALVRPGRIDTVVELKAPDKSLRKRYIDSWKVVLNDSIRQKLVDSTHSFSFAELNYLQSQIVMMSIQGKIDIDKAIEDSTRKWTDRNSGKRVGFN